MFGFGNDKAALELESSAAFSIGVSFSRKRAADLVSARAARAAHAAGTHTAGTAAAAAAAAHVGSRRAKRVRIETVEAALGLGALLAGDGHHLRVQTLGAFGCACFRAEAEAVRHEADIAAPQVGEEAVVVLLASRGAEGEIAHAHAIGRKGAQTLGRAAAVFLVVAADYAALRAHLKAWRAWPAADVEAEAFAIGIHRAGGARGASALRHIDANAKPRIALAVAVALRIHSALRDAHARHGVGRIVVQTGNIVAAPALVGIEHIEDGGERRFASFAAAHAVARGSHVEVKACAGSTGTIGILRAFLGAVAVGRAAAELRVVGVGRDADHVRAAFSVRGAHIAERVLGRSA